MIDSNGSRDLRTYRLLVATLAILGAVAVYLPGAAPAGLPTGELASRPIMALVTLVALGGLHGGLQ